MTESGSKAFIIQRGRQQSILSLFKSLKIPDLYFDFRPYGRCVRLRLLLKFFLTTFELPNDLSLIICEGSLCTLLAISYKILVNKRVKIITYVVDPTFWSKSLKLRFSFRLRASLYRTFVKHTVAISTMVREDALKHNFCRLSSISVVCLPSFRVFPEVCNTHEDRSFSQKGYAKLIFMADRPSESGYTKGLDVFLGIAHIYSLLPNCQHSFYLVGKGSEVYDLYAPNVKAVGHLSDISEIFSSSDLFILPSRYDASSIALLEAIGFGLLPLVSSRVGYSTLLQQTVCPYYNPVVSSSSTTEWISAIEQTLSLPYHIKDQLISAYLVNCQNITLDSATHDFKEILSRYSNPSS